MNATMPASKKLLLGTIHKDLAAKMMKEKGRDLAHAIRDALPESYQYLVLLKEGENVAFFTDADRDEAIRALRKTLAQLEDP